jgi:hypothetical protein
MSKRRFPTDLETAQSLNKVQREELGRLRAETETKDATIKALADALEHLHSRVMLSAQSAALVANALRLAGRLP